MINPDAPVSLFTRLRDWLTYRPWTDEQLAERVAKSVANTSYARNWGRPIEGRPVAGGLQHRFEFEEGVGDGPEIIPGSGRTP